MAGLGPVPFCGMLLADHGAEVVRIDRPGVGARVGQPEGKDVTGRGKTSISADLRDPQSLAGVLDLITQADIVLEGFRPGVMERLGLGPEVCLQRHPGLIYGRMTGWGQQGPLSHAAGHDINYLSITGLLHAMGDADRPPVPPLNLVADFGGGAMFLAFGILAALHERTRCGKGQVVDAAMTDGTALLGSMFHGMRADGHWGNQRSANLLDGGAPFYRTYRCADGKFIAVGALEPQFYALLRERCGLDDPEFAVQMETGRWPVQRERLAALFLQKPQADWCRLLEGTDACVTPVVDWDEAVRHPHNVARQTFAEVDGVMQAAPAPRLSRTPAAAPHAGCVVDPRDAAAIARDWLGARGRNRTDTSCETGF